MLYLEGVHWSIDDIVQWNLKSVYRFLSFLVHKECLLIVHAVLYLKNVNWSNMVTKCDLHPKRNFGFFWVFWCFPAWKNSQNSREATPFPSIRHHYESPIKVMMVSFLGDLMIMMLTEMWEIGIQNLSIRLKPMLHKFKNVHNEIVVLTYFIHHKWRC